MRRVVPKLINTSARTHDVINPLEIAAVHPQKDPFFSHSTTRIKLCVQGVLSVALFDTGCVANIISARRFMEWRNMVGFTSRNPVVLNTSDQLYSANWNPISMQGEVLLNFEIGDLRFVDVPFLIQVDDGAEDICLGKPFLDLCDGFSLMSDSLAITKKIESRHVQFRPFEDEINAPVTAVSDLVPDCYRSDTQHFRVICAKDTVIPPDAYGTIPVRVIYPNRPKLKDMEDAYVLEPHPGVAEALNITMFPALVTPSQVQIIPVLNDQYDEVNIKKGEEIGLASLVWNPPEAPISLHRRYQRMSAIPPPPPISNGIPLKKRYEFLDENLQLDEGDLAENHKSDLKRLIYAYADLISTGDTDIGRTNLATHEIDTGSHSPICQKPYRVEFKNRHVIEEEVEKMLSIDLIEPARSPWSSPVVLIPKKDGSVRFCVDFRKLNAVTVRDTFPLPRIDDIIPLLGKKKFFVGLDLASGYWQVPMSDSKDSKNKTTFTCHVGTFRFKYMPFGGMNAPATFQRLMQQVLGSQYNKNVFCYLDDILVTGETWSELMEELQEVFRKLRGANLKLKLKKCEWGKTHIEYLGHLLEHDGYSPKQKKVQAILEKSKPKTMKELRGLIGMFGFYAKFIPHYTELMRPLHHLLKEKTYTPTKWNHECEESLGKLKKAITEAPVLAFPDQELPFKLYADASAEAIGAVLTQVQNGEEHPIAYYSRALNTSEMNYSNTDRECLACLAALRHFYAILYGCKVTVYSDHMAAVWLHRQENPTKRAAIFQDHLRQEIFWTVEHVSGKDNPVADFLSRFLDLESKSAPAEGDSVTVPEIMVQVPKMVQVVTRGQKAKQEAEDSAADNPNTQKQEEVVKSEPEDGLSDFSSDSEDEELLEINLAPARPVPTVPNPMLVKDELVSTETDPESDPNWPFWTNEFLDRLREEQNNDPVLSHIFKYLDDPKHIPEDTSIRKRYNHWLKGARNRYSRNSANLLVFDNFYASNDDLKIVVPGSMQEEILCHYHGPEFVGHTGKDKLVERLKRRFFWKGMATTVNNHIDHCKPCLQFKKSAVFAPMLPIKCSKPWQIIHVDLHGPLPRTEDGNTHILGFIDSLTRFAIAKPVSELTAERVAQIYLDEVVWKFGPAQCIFSDQGKQFTSQLLREIAKLYHTKPLVTAPYTPRANGKIERFWGSISTNLKIYAGEFGDTWDESLPMIVYAYNTSQARSTKFSPHEALFGVKPLVPFETLLLPPVRQTQDFTDFSKRKIGIYRKTLKVIQKNQDEYVDYSQQKWEQRHARKKVFAVGDRVLQRHYVKKSKLDPDFDEQEYVITFLNPSGTMAVMVRPDEPLKAIQVCCQHLKKVPPLPDPPDGGKGK